jgi:hypothetical protein
MVKILQVIDDIEGFSATDGKVISHTPGKNFNQKKRQEYEKDILATESTGCYHREIFGFEQPSPPIFPIA